MSSIWKQVEKRWPAGGEIRGLGYWNLETRASDLLSCCSVVYLGFSHYAIPLNILR